MFVFEPLKLMLIILLSSMLPCIPLTLWFLRNSKLAWFEKLPFGFIAGTMLIPALLWAEGMLGIYFSLPLLLANIFALFIIGIALCIKDKMLEIPTLQMPPISTHAEIFDAVKKYSPAVFLFLLMFLAFWLRIQSWGPVYSELDPYFYLYSGGEIIKDGISPASDTTAWFDKLNPGITYSHRTHPLDSYLEAQWYSLYTAGGAYERYLFSTIANFYPPFISMFMCFGAYLLASSLLGRRYGIFAAALFAFTSSLILKMQAGVAEGQPYGFFAVLFFFGAYAAALKLKDIRIALFAALAFFATVTGSAFADVIMLVIVAFIPIESLRLFLAYKHHESHGHHQQSVPQLAKHILTSGARNYQEFFLQLNLLVFAGVIVANSMVALYLSPSYPILGVLAPSLFQTSVLVLAAAILSSFVLYFLGRMLPLQTVRLQALGALMVVALLLFFLSPVGSMVRSYVGAYAGSATYPSPLERTIAEQGQSGASFESQTGFIGRTLSQGDVGNMPQNIQGILGWLFVLALSLIAAPFSLLANIFFQLIDFIVNLFFQLGMQTSEKTPSLFLLILMCAFLYTLITYLSLFLQGFGKKSESASDDSRNAGAIALIFALIIFPIAYIGINKIKYLVFLGLVGSLAMVLTVALVEQAVLLLALTLKKDRHLASKVSYAVCIVLIASTVLFQFADERSAVAKPLLVASLSTRYQDSPTGAGMEKMAQLCAQIKAMGQSDTDICAAGSNPKFAESIENQFNPRLCLYSQISNITNPDRDQLAGAQLRCSMLSSYWLDSMEWIRSHTENGSRITSWWDYGHWINFFGERNAVLRNEHARKDMIQEIAHAYIDGTPQEIADAMDRFDSKYALFDVELISSGNIFGGKYGALNYLSCARDNQTTVQVWPGSSKCEFEHMFETIYVPKTSREKCIVSPSQQISGVVGFVDYYVGDARQLKKEYCMATINLADGRRGLGTYYLDRKDADGNLVLNKAFVQQYSSEQDYDVYFTVYNNDKVWQGQNGTLVGGYEDRKGKFYDSALYRAFYLNDLPGFKQVYQTPGGEVKIYEWLGYKPYSKAS
ncbi:Uncharacterised protein [Candidatus Anstonella stagnisolia]|nr:Uncharacterised protein [Candidatus Anstonella stagnisolia]